MPDTALGTAALPTQATPVDPLPPQRPSPARPYRLLLIAAEAAVALGVGIGFMLWARNIHVNPMIRIGQVSGLGRLQFRAALVALPVLGVLLYAAHRWDSDRFRLLLRFGCAALAGLGTGIVAGGIAVALRGTPWGLGGQDGDPGTLQGYAMSLLRGEGLPDLYPPGFIMLLVSWTKFLRHDHVGFALKDLQLLFGAVFGPFCYLAWRSLLRPAWALAVALPAAILFLDPIRPYSHLVMVMLLPLVGRLLTELTRAAGRPVRALLLRGAGLGALFGTLYLLYSGWFVWSTPGVLVAVLALTPGDAAGRRSAGPPCCSAPPRWPPSRWPGPRSTGWPPTAPPRWTVTPTSTSTWTRRTWSAGAPTGRDWPTGPPGRRPATWQDRAASPWCCWPGWRWRWRSGCAVRRWWPRWPAWSAPGC
ncbi:hypothetical protein ACFQ0T_25220 [Kitasatospora gansuensis]